jgi:hypothetical protein
VLNEILFIEVVEVCLPEHADFRVQNCNHKFKYTTYMYIRYMLFYIKWRVIMEVIVEYPGTLNRELVQLASKITTKITIFVFFH